MAIERMFADDENRKVVKQIAIGSVSGWLCGFVSMKVGKLAAVSLGAGLILVQVANTKGYININWSRLSNDVDKVKTRIQEEASGKQQWTDKLEKKLDKQATELIAKQRRFYHSIVGGESENDQVVKDVCIYAGSFVLGFGVGVLTGN